MKRYSSLFAIVMLSMIVSTAFLSDPKTSKGTGKQPQGNAVKATDSAKSKTADPVWLKKNPKYKPAWNSPEWVKPKVVEGC